MIEDLAPDRLEKLHALVAELLRVNRLFNLTSIREPEAAWQKHIVDSLQALASDLFEGEKRVIDVGSGAGFPALALAAARPDLKVTALDSTRKKCDFIDATAALLGLPVTAVCERAESACHDAALRGWFDVATARAVGSFSEVCELTLPFVRVGGAAILWRGRDAEAEVAAAGSAFSKLGADESAVKLYPYRFEGSEMSYCLVVVPKGRNTPAGYPRRVGLPKQRPL